MVLGLLVLTGFALFLSSWRQAIGPFFLAVQWVHTVGGILYGVAIVGWSRAFFPWLPRDGRQFAPGYAGTGQSLLRGLQRMKLCMLPITCPAACSKELPLRGH